VASRLLQLRNLCTIWRALLAKDHSSAKATEVWMRTQMRKWRKSERDLSIQRNFQDVHAATKSNNLDINEVGTKVGSITTAV